MPPEAAAAVSALRRSSSLAPNTLGSLNAGGMSLLDDNEGEMSSDEFVMPVTVLTVEYVNIGRLMVIIVLQYLYCCCHISLSSVSYIRLFCHVKKEILANDQPHICRICGCLLMLQ